MPTDWVTLRLVVRDRDVQVYAGQVETATLEVRKLGQLEEGMVGLWQRGLREPGHHASAVKRAARVRRVLMIALWSLLFGTALGVFFASGRTLTTRVALHGRSAPLTIVHYMCRTCKAGYPTGEIVHGSGS